MRAFLKTQYKSEINEEFMIFKRKALSTAIIE